MSSLRLVSLCLALLACLPAVALPDVADQFAMGNDFYEKRDYSSAIRMYEAVLNDGVESATLYYNLGNAYFKSGDRGRAVLNYLRAKRLDPADEDLNHNLEFALRFAQVQMEGVELNPIRAFFQSLIGPYRLTTLAWFSSALFVLLVVLLIARFGIGLSTSALRVAVTVVLVLTLASAGLTTFKYRTDYLARTAVILSDDAVVLAGPTANADVEFRGASGLVVEILTESGEYANVLFENKRRGWVHKDLVAEI